MTSDKTRAFDRRSFFRRATALGGGVMAASFLNLLGARKARADFPSDSDITAGDVDILRFLAAAELVEDDLWQQYSELAVGNAKFAAALRRIDPALIRYIQDDRDDERSHAALINAFLESIGEEAVNLDAFRTLPSVQSDGAEDRGRLTNLTNLNVDTSWFNRYRGAGNPDFGDQFPQLVTLTNRPAIPTSDKLKANDIQVIAHTAAFHFCAIEQGGGSLYNSLLTKASGLDVLALLATIGPTEVYHFAAFHKSLERIFALNGSGGLRFPNLRRLPDIAQAIFPEPCTFLSASFPLCSVIRPRSTANAGAVAAATGLVNSGLFGGQSQEFFDAVTGLAIAADSATRLI